MGFLRQRRCGAVIWNNQKSTATFASYSKALMFDSVVQHCESGKRTVCSGWLLGPDWYLIGLEIWNCSRKFGNCFEGWFPSFSHYTFTKWGEISKTLILEAARVFHNSINLHVIWSVPSGEPWNFDTLMLWDSKLHASPTQICVWEELRSGPKHVNYILYENRNSAAPQIDKFK